VTKPRPRRERTSEIDEVSWRYLNDATTDKDREEHGWLIDTLDFNLTGKDAVVVPPPTGKSTEQLWKEYGAEVIRWWIKDQPGTRPRCWWRFSAPDACRAKPTSPNDIPTFKSQAAYLKRLGLLLPGEEKRLQADLDAGVI
jgi:hypothetical protein